MISIRYYDISSCISFLAAIVHDQWYIWYTITWSRTDTFIHIRYTGRELQRTRAYTYLRQKWEREIVSALTRGNVNASYMPKSEQEENRRISMSTIIPTIPRRRLPPFENDPAGRWKEGGEGHKGLESRLVDESDKKFIRRSVGAAPPRRWRRAQRKRKKNNKEKKGWRIANAVLKGHSRQKRDRERWRT